MDGQHLHILWTNADPVVFDKMVLMYAVNSRCGAGGKK